MRGDLDKRGARRVIAIDPTGRGFAYAILEGPGRLIDWASLDIPSGSRRDLATRVLRLFKRFEPLFFVIESPVESRRGNRAKTMIRKLVSTALLYGIPVQTVTRMEVRLRFGGANVTKYQIALSIGRRFPVLAPRLPRKRKAWMSEDGRMNIFDAISFALTHFDRGERAGAE